MLYRIQYEDLRSGRIAERTYDDEKMFLAVLDEFKKDIWKRLIATISPDGTVVTF